jgi:hypothetical protein
MTLKLVDLPPKTETPTSGETPNLRLNAHAGQLAVAAFCHHQQLYQHDTRSWGALSAAEQHLWVMDLAEFLRDREPAKCLMGCGRYVRPGDTYCDDPICSIQAERDR